MSDQFRDSLPSDAENYDVWCERCQKVHRHFTYTREDHDRIISEGARKLAEAIDAEAARKIYADVYGAASPPPPRSQE